MRAKQRGDKQHMQHAITDDLEALLATLPPSIHDAVNRLENRSELLEIVMDLGRLAEGRFPEGEVILSTSPVGYADLEYVVERIGEFGDDNRAGIERTLHRISALRNRKGKVVGLTCRIGRAVLGSLALIRDIVEQGQSILILGRPGVGKTTLLREIARVLADEANKRVVVVDTSNEIAGDGDIPHPGIGRARRMQVPSPEQQHAVMIEAVENHMPQVIVIDEIGTTPEALAARTIAERGVQLIATAHGNTLDNLLQNPTLSDLVGGIQAVTLGDDEARRRGTQKTVLERKAPPTFDVVIEIQDKDRLAVHHDVAHVVDRFLRGAMPHPEIRTRTPEGEVRITSGEVAVQAMAAASNGHTAPVAPPQKVVRIYPYAVSRNRLERAIRELRVPAMIAEALHDADVLLTLKSQERRQPKRLREAGHRGLPTHIIKSNTLSQIETVLREIFGVQDRMSPEEQAMREAEEAISEVMAAAQPVELGPQNSYLRRLQHQLIQRYGLASESKGTDPFRRVVIYPK